MKSESDAQIDKLEYQIQELKRRVAALRRARPREKAASYEFLNWENRTVPLLELFDGRDELILVHNMGKSCSYCTMWADGFIGLEPHLSDRAAFVVTSPDTPEEQREFAAARGWKFRMYSADERFIDEMGFLDPDEGLMPGVSVFVREGDEVFRVSRAEFGPGDEFCAVWHFFDLLPEGANGWEPRYAYEHESSSVCCSSRDQLGN